MATDKELADFLKSVEKRAWKRAVYAVRDEDAALDIVQDTMIRLAEKYADRPPAEITSEIQERIRELLPDPVPSAAEANTGDFPAIRAEVLTPTRQPGDRHRP